MVRGPAKLGFAAVALTALAALTVAACLVPRADAHARSNRPALLLAQSSSSTVTLRAAKVGKLGTILVNRSGHVLYMYAPDRERKVTCNFSCQSFWPALAAPAHGAAKATDGVKQSLVGSDRNPYGKGRVVTYDGWPLYTYIGDSSAGVAHGQNINVNGGYWWVIRPDGKLVK